jgi:hypothetical protein
MKGNQQHAPVSLVKYAAPKRDKFKKVKCKYSGKNQRRRLPQQVESTAMENSAEDGNTDHPQQIVIEQLTVTSRGNRKERPNWRPHRALVAVQKKITEL